MIFRLFTCTFRFSVLDTCKDQVFVNCFDATVKPHLACKLCFIVVVSRCISKTFMCTSYMDDNLNTLIPVEPVKLASSFIQHCHIYTS